MRTRVLFVACQTHNASDGGLESATRIFEGLANECEWTLVTTRSSDFTARWIRHGARVKIVPQLSESLKLFRCINYVILTLSVFVFTLSFRSHIIHANDSKAYRAATVVTTMVRRRLIISIRDTKPPDEDYSAAHWGRLSKDQTEVVTLSSSMAESLSVRIGIPMERITIIRSLVDTGSESGGSGDVLTARAGLGIDVEEFVVLVIGAFRPKKNQLTLLLHLAANKSDLLRFRFLFLGDCNPERDDYAKACINAVRIGGLESHVLILGHQREMRVWYDLADAVLVASKNEGLARAMIEALSAGLPVVSFDVASAEEFLTNNSCGMVRCQGDYAGLISCLKDLRDNPELYSRLCAAAIQTAEKLLDKREVLNGYRLLYDRVKPRT